MTAKREEHHQYKVPPAPHGIVMRRNARAIAAQAAERSERVLYGSRSHQSCTQFVAARVHQHSTTPPRNVPRSCFRRLPGSPTITLVEVEPRDQAYEWHATTYTGVPNKRYRVSQQMCRRLWPVTPVETPAKPRNISGSCSVRRCSPLHRVPQQAYRVPQQAYRGPRQKVPGSPTKTTGVPDKNYRGAEQGLPGSLTRTTGVPDKPLFKITCKMDTFLIYSWFLCIVVSCCLLCLDNRVRHFRRRTG